MPTKDLKDPREAWQPSGLVQFQGGGAGVQLSVPQANQQRCVVMTLFGEIRNDHGKARQDRSRLYRFGQLCVRWSKASSMHHRIAGWIGEERRAEFCQGRP